MFFDLIDNVVTHDILIEEVRSCETKHYLDDVKNLANREMLHISVENFFHKLEEVSKSVGIYDLKSRLLYTSTYMMEALQALEKCSLIIKFISDKERLSNDHFRSSLDEKFALFDKSLIYVCLDLVKTTASIIEEAGLKEDLAFKIKNFDLNKLAFDGFELVLGKHPDQTSFTEFCAEFDFFRHKLDSVLNMLPEEYVN
jgi:hypothetical protein